MVDYGTPFRDFYRSSDPSWSSKMLRGALIALASLVLTPVIVGLAGWFILTGYGLRLLLNVRNGEVHPLPEWGQNMEGYAQRFQIVRGYSCLVCARHRNRVAARLWHPAAGNCQCTKFHIRPFPRYGISRNIHNDGRR